MRRLLIGDLKLRLCYIGHIAHRWGITFYHLPDRSMASVSRHVFCERVLFGHWRASLELIGHIFGRLMQMKPVERLFFHLLISFTDYLLLVCYIEVLLRSCAS